MCIVTHSSTTSIQHRRAPRGCCASACASNVEIGQRGRASLIAALAKVLIAMMRLMPKPSEETVASGMKPATMRSLTLAALLAGALKPAR